MSTLCDHGSPSLCTSHTPWAWLREPWTPASLLCVTWNLLSRPGWALLCRPLLRRTVLWFLVTLSCLALCHPLDCSPPGSSAHGIFQARILEWVAIFLLQGIFPTQGSNPCLPSLLYCRRFFTCWAIYLLLNGSPAGSTFALPPHSVLSPQCPDWSRVALCLITRPLKSGRCGENLVWPWSSYFTLFSHNASSVIWRI